MEKEELQSSVNAEKLKVLNSTLEKLEKQFGKVFLPQKHVVSNISTNC